MEIVFFVDWSTRHGKENYEMLVNKVCDNAPVPKELAKREDIYKTVYRFKVLYLSYIAAALKYFKLEENQISFIIDILLKRDGYASINSRDILGAHKDAISDMEEFIKKDFNKFIK